MSSDETQKSLAWVNNARILAIVAVVILHAAASVVRAEEIIGKPWWWVGNIYDSFARWGVPVFVMLSGALLLFENKTEASAVFYKKRMSKILIPCLFWSIFFVSWTFFHNEILNKPIPGLQDVSENLLRGMPYFHMWFLYMIIGLYAVTPFLRIVLRNLPVKQIIGIVVVLFVISMANDTFVGLEKSGAPLFIDQFPAYLPYFILGYLIRKYNWEMNAGIASTIFIVSAVFTALGSYLLFKVQGISKGQYFYSNFSITVIPMTICMLFLLKKSGGLIVNGRLAKRLAGKAFGIYLIHPFVMDIENLAGFSVFQFNPLFSIPAFAAATLFISAVFVWIIRFFPYLRRIT